MDNSPEMKVRTFSARELAAELTIRQKGRPGEWDFTTSWLIVEIERRAMLQAAQEKAERFDPLEEKGLGPNG